MSSNQALQNEIVSFESQKSAYRIRPINTLIPVEFDRISFTNADGNGNYQTGTVKKDGATVGTLTLAYDANSNLTDIAWSV